MPSRDWDDLDDDAKFDVLRRGYRSVLFIIGAVVVALSFGAAVLILNDHAREVKSEIRDDQFQQIACLDLPYAKLSDPRAKTLHKTYPECPFGIYPPRVETHTLTVIPVKVPRLPPTATPTSVPTAVPRKPRTPSQKVTTARPTKPTKSPNANRPDATVRKPSVGPVVRTTSPQPRPSTTPLVCVDLGVLRLGC